MIRDSITPGTALPAARRGDGRAPAAGRDPFRRAVVCPESGQAGVYACGAGQAPSRPAWTISPPDSAGNRQTGAFGSDGRTPTAATPQRQDRPSWMFDNGRTPSTGSRLGPAVPAQLASSSSTGSAWLAWSTVLHRHPSRSAALRAHPAGGSVTLRSRSRERSVGGKRTACSAVSWASSGIAAPLFYQDRRLRG